MTLGVRFSGEETITAKTSNDESKWRACIVSVLNAKEGECERTNADKEVNEPDNFVLFHKGFLLCDEVMYPLYRKPEGSGVYSKGVSGVSIQVPTVLSLTCLGVKTMGTYWPLYQRSNWSP